MFKYIAALCLIACCISANPLSSSCPDVKAVQNFQAAKYLGKWYEQARYPFIFQLNAKCTTANYSLRDDGKIKVVNRDVNGLSGVTETIVGFAYNVSATEAKFIVNFPTMPIHIDAPYWVVGTDYENFSVVWSCQALGPLTGKYSWILTREPKPSKDVMDKIEQVIKDSGIDKAPFQKTTQDNCTYE